MTPQQKTTIAQYRAQGASYSFIASRLGLSVNTVKSYCQRNNIQADTALSPSVSKAPEYCPQCNAPLLQTPGHRKKRFCSPKCRSAWWAVHRKQANADRIICVHCGNSFRPRIPRPGKYCSRECYLAHRYGEGGGKLE